MGHLLFHGRRLLLSYLLESMLRYRSWRAAAADRKKKKSRRDAAPTLREAAPTVQDAVPRSPEDFRPLERACFQNPYGFYKMLRDDYPVYRLANGIFCVSRYEDIVAITRDTKRFSSKHQGAMLQVKPGQSIAELSGKLESLAAKGIMPSSVLAVTDPPEHKRDRKIGQNALNPTFIRSLEDEVEAMTRHMMDEFIDDGQVEFMQQFAWRLPMRLIIRQLGLPETDYSTVKRGCQSAIALLSGNATVSELYETSASNLGFFRYCWSAYLKARRAPGDHLVDKLSAAAANADNGFTDQHAVSVIHQLLIAGSDSSATTMGNAVKMMLENPGIEADLRRDPGRIPAFIEEVLRLDSAFQGHFRWTKTDCELHGVPLPRGSRVFLMWASGNRDERFWDEPDRIKLDRENGRRHLTFGHGIHGCLGRELARLEIRVVLKALLARTTDLRITGDAPYVASMFARTLVRLPLTFSAVPNVAETKCIGRAA